MASALYRASKLALMFRASTRLPPWTNFSILGYIPSKDIHLFVINYCVLIDTELAEFWTGCIMPAYRLFIISDLVTHVSISIIYLSDCRLIREIIFRIL
jgi:hypothetical protein